MRFVWLYPEIINTVAAGGKVRNENPDIVLLCGDIFDDKPPIDDTIEFLQGGLAGRK